MKVIIASDHAGFALKEKLKGWLAGKGFGVEDLGPNSEESVDYPDFAAALARKVAGEWRAGAGGAAGSAGAEGTAGGGCFGILVCGAGIGMSMCANKIPGARAALCWNPETAKLSREHNNANILCMGARVLEDGLAEKIAEVFLSTEFSKEGRHAKRVEKMDALCKHAGCGC